MKLYPYTQIQTKNLTGLLIAAKLIAFLSYLIFFTAILVGVIGILQDTPKTFELSSGIQATMSSPGTTLPAVMFALSGTLSAIFLFILSGLCAAVVSCEHKYTST